jgi:hypothetical protein
VPGGIFFSVRRAYHNRGVNGVMLYRVSRAMRARGYSHLGMSWDSDTDGRSLRQMENGATPLRRLHLFRKGL